MAFTAITACALFILISLTVHRFFISVIDGQINSVPLLKKMWACFEHWLSCHCFSYNVPLCFLFWWLCQHKGLLWMYYKMLHLCSSLSWFESWPPLIIKAVFIHIKFEFSFSGSCFITMLGNIHFLILSVLIAVLVTSMWYWQGKQLSKIKVLQQVGL